jgi:hypothetical protein
MGKPQLGANVFACTLVFSLLGACGGGSSMATNSDDMAHPVDLSGVWAPESQYVDEGIASGVPITMHNTGWAPLSDGAPEDRVAPTFEEQKARMEAVIEQNIDIFALLARNRFQPPYNADGLTAVEQMEANQTSQGSPYERCLPSNTTGFGGTTRMIQKGDLVVAISENGLVRHVYLDDRDPANALPAFEGYSIGHFNDDGDLVVETTAFLGTSFNGWPMSYDARLIETLSLSEDGNELTIKSQYEDPTYLAEPVARMTYLFRQPSEYELIFSSCVENVYGSQIFSEEVPDYINERRELQ